MPQVDESCALAEEPARDGFPMGAVLGWALVAVALIGVAMMMRKRKAAAAVLLIALGLGLAGCAGLEALADHTLPATQAELDAVQADAQGWAEQAAERGAAGDGIGAAEAGGTAALLSLLGVLGTVWMSRRRRRVELAKQVVAEAKKAA